MTRNFAENVDAIFGLKETEDPNLSGLSQSVEEKYVISIAPMLPHLAPTRIQNVIPQMMIFCLVTRLHLCTSG